MTADEIAVYTMETNPEIFVFYQATLPTQCTYTLAPKVSSSEHWQRVVSALAAAKEG